MRELEAKKIFNLVESLNLKPGARCLNIGSSTRRFREVDKPHIYSELIRPLETLGTIVINCDLKDADGVDLVGNVLDPSFQERMKFNEPDVLLCCNLLEHLESPAPFADACGKLVKERGFLVVSVPLSYPYHPDPIDTMFRPTPNELEALFPGWRVISSEVLVMDNFLTDALAKPGGVVLLIKHVLKVLVPFYRPKYWLPKAHRLLWCFRKYKNSIVVFQKRAD